MAGNRGATPAQPGAVGVGSTRDRARGGLFKSNTDQTLNANAAQQVEVDTQRAEDAAREAAASATSAATAAGTAIMARDAAEGYANDARDYANDARADAEAANSSAQLSREWAVGNNNRITIQVPDRNSSGQLLGTWMSGPQGGTLTSRSGTLDEWLADTTTGRTNFEFTSVDRVFEPGANPTDGTPGNSSRDWAIQTALDTLQFAQAEQELAEAINHATNAQVDAAFVDALVALARAYDNGVQPTADQITLLISRGVIPDATAVPVLDPLTSGDPDPNVVYSARALSTYVSRRATAAETSADDAAMSAQDASDDADRAEAAVTTVTDARDEVRRVAGLDVNGNPLSPAPMGSVPAQLALAETAATGARTAETNAETAEANARAWAEGSDTEVDALGGEHSSETWSNQSRDWAGRNATIDPATGRITFDDGELQRNYPNAHSAAFYAEEARMHSNNAAQAITVWSGTEAYQQGHLVTYQPTNGANRVYEAIVNINAPGPTDPANMPPLNNSAQWVDIASSAAAGDEITVRTGSTVNTDVQDVEFNDTYFNQNAQASNAAHGVVINLDSEAVFMRWNPDFSYTESPASFVTYAGNLYKALMDSDSSNSQTPPMTGSNAFWQLIDLQNPDLTQIMSQIMGLRDDLGMSMDAADATGTAFARIEAAVEAARTLSTTVSGNATNIQTIQDELGTSNEDADETGSIYARLNFLDQEIIHITQDNTPVPDYAIVYVIQGSFHQVYWRFGGRTTSSPSDFIGTNGSPMDNVDGYVRLSGGGSSGGSGTTVHYQDAAGRTLDLTEVEFDQRNQTSSPQIIFTGSPTTGNDVMDTIPLMEVYPEMPADSDPELHAIRIGTTVYRIPAGGTPAPGTPPSLSFNEPTIALYQAPAMHTITFTGTLMRGTLPSMNFENDVTISGVTVDANSIMRTGDHTFTFTVTINTQTEMAATHPFTVTITNVTEDDGGTTTVGPATGRFHTADERNRNRPTPPARTRMFSSTTQPPADDDMMRALAIRTHASSTNLNQGLAYDIESITVSSDAASPISITNADGSLDYSIVNAQIPATGSRDIQIVYNFPSTPINGQPSEMLSDTVTISRYDPWFLVAAPVADPDDETQRHEIDMAITDGQVGTITTTQDDALFILTTANLAATRISGQRVTVIERGTRMVGPRPYTRYQITTTRPAGTFAVTVELGT